MDANALRINREAQAIIDVRQNPYAARCLAKCREREDAIGPIV